jgi:DNA-binding NarL/FixJ family response regulator
MPNYSRKIQIIIAEEVELRREGLKLMLTQFDDIELVGIATNGIEAVSFAIEWAPAVALIDWEMSRLDGLVCAQEIKRNASTVRTLIMSNRPVNKALLDSLEHSVDGFIGLNVSGEILARAIRSVAAGQRYLSPEATSALINRVGTTGDKSDKSPTLSNRELEVLQLMARLDTYNDIAKTLLISENTVRTYVRRILTKLNQPNRTLAVVEGLRRHLIFLNPQSP